MDMPPTLILTPYSYFEWEPKVLLLLKSKGLYWITMGTKAKSNSVVEKAHFLNRLDKAFRLICLSISPKLLFHIEYAPHQMKYGPHWRVYSRNKMILKIAYRECQEKSWRKAIGRSR
jgi:hypothetical protein